MKTSDTLQGLVLGQVLFNISAGDIETGIEYTLSMCDTELCGVLEGRDTIQADLDRLEWWVHEIWQGQVQCPGSGQSQAQVQAEQRID